jgi:glucose-fructose oxidoreductase
MIAAAEANDVKLMIAYRLHFERASLAAVELLRSGKIGEPRIFSSDFTMQVRDEDNIRLQAGLGGGTLYDIGIYCINVARALFRSEPIEVMATVSSGDDQSRFREVEEMASAILRFPDEKLATFTCSFGAADVSSYRVIGTKGDLRVEPAFEYAEGLEHHLTVGGRTRTRQFAKSDQFAPEIEHFSECIREDREPRASGRDGLNDVRIIEALYASAESRTPVRLGGLEPGDEPDMTAEKRKPPVRKPKVLHAQSPHAD